MKQFRNATCWPFTLTVALNPLAVMLSILTMIASSGVWAQNINNGRALYITQLVAGQPFSCSSGQCHGPSPANNQNKIQVAADDPGRIGLAISQVAQMAFLKNNVTGAQLADLAAYIGNPGGVTGTPVAQVSPGALSFASTVVGSSSTAQLFTINNTGNAELTVSGVSSNSSEFLVLNACSSVAAGASCNVSVSFAPNTVGARSGTITVSHNATGGSSTVSLSGTATAPVLLSPAIAVSPSSLNFGSVSAGSFSGALIATVSSVGTAPLTLTSIAINGGNFAAVGGSCVVGTAISVSGSCTVLVRYSPEAVGAHTATLTIGHNAGTPTVTVSLSGTGTAAPPPNTKTMVEYLFVPLNYYFVTSRDTDKLALDTIADFQRTGLSFPVLATQVANTKGITRFYFDKVAVHGTRGSHFYTLLDEEKAALNGLNPTNATTAGLPFDEGVDSWAFLPLVTGPGGSCASGQTPVFRLFRGNARFPDDPNHRFTVSVATYNDFVALGWDGEGVRFCVPAQ